MKIEREINLWSGMKFEASMNKMHGKMVNMSQRWHTCKSGHHLLKHSVLANRMKCCDWLAGNKTVHTQEILSNQPIVFQDQNP